MGLMASPQKLLLILRCSGLMCCSPLGGNKPVLGVIGCMAERLKSRLFEEEAVDIIAGPDALRSVPGLIDLFCQVNATGSCLFVLLPSRCSAGPHGNERAAKACRAS